MWELLEPRLRDLARRAGMRDVPPAVVAAAVVLALLAVAWGAWRWWPRGESGANERDTLSRGVVATAMAEGGAGDASGVAGASEVATEKPAELLTVHVAGRVRNPGVYQLAAGSRVIDALEAAGGGLGDAAANALNLARPLADGEQIVVPSEEEAAQGRVAGTGGGGAPAGSGGVASQQTAVVNINTADAAALDTLPGVGPSTAQKIISDREANGPFASPEDLGRVSGIGPKRLEQLAELICVQ